jgi:hypothetical protein
MAKGYVVYQDSNPANVLAMFFSGNGSQNALLKATEWKELNIPSGDVKEIEMNSYTLVETTESSILP